MIHDDIRAARLAAGLSVTELAQRSGVTRKQIHDLEGGSNITLETLRRVVQALPNLKRVTLGGLEIVTANADLEEARRAALDLFDVAKRLIGALGASPTSATPRPPAE
jgi:transcriptional regulator with XRE-family HTH domain